MVATRAHCILLYREVGEDSKFRDLEGSHKSIFEGASPRGAGGVWRRARDSKSGHITNRSKKRHAETTLDPGAATVRERSSSSIALANPTAPSRSRLDALGDAAFDAATLKCHAL